MGEQIQPGRYILGDDLSVLDLYVTVIFALVATPCQGLLRRRAADGGDRPAGSTPSPALADLLGGAVSPSQRDGRAEPRLAGGC